VDAGRIIIVTPSKTPFCSLYDWSALIRCVAPAHADHAKNLAFKTRRLWRRPNCNLNCCATQDAAPQISRSPECWSLHSQSMFTHFKAWRTWLDEIPIHFRKDFPTPRC
jgi:hypothetical protein